MSMLGDTWQIRFYVWSRRTNEIFISYSKTYL